MGAPGVMEVNIYFTEFYQNTVKITIEIAVLGSLTFNVLSVFKVYYCNL